MPLRELERLQSVNRFLKLDFSKEEELQNLITLAAELCHCPVALLTFIDEDKQCTNVRISSSSDPGTGKDPFCERVVRNGDMLVIEDIHSQQPAATGPGAAVSDPVRFYAGTPLITQDGHALGTLCVTDNKPGQLSEVQRKALRSLARQIIQLLEFDVSLQILKSQYVQARQSEIELRSFFESSLDHHLLLDSGFRILAFNRAWNNHVHNTYGLTMKRGELMTPYIHPRNFQGFYDDYISALNGKPVFDERCLTVKGKDTWRRVRFEPASDAAGKIIGVSVNCADITQQVEQKEIVNKQQMALRQIAFLQSHELRKPVASILGLISLLDPDRPGELIRQAEEIRLLQLSARELDDKIRLIIDHASANKEWHD
ncbi:GAF domain-containing protein [Mucilaginibacter conchicola]|nr:GAF domain-containing protein [Mucilaginibacter conchicola]